MAALNPSGKLRFTGPLSKVSAFAEPGILTLENYLFAKSFISGKPYHRIIAKRTTSSSAKK